MRALSVGVLRVLPRIPPKESFLVQPPEITESNTVIAQILINPRFSSDLHKQSHFRISDLEYAYMCKEIRILGFLDGKEFWIECARD